MLGASDSTGDAVQKRLELLRLDMVGAHHRLNQRIREEVVNLRTVTERHGAPFRLAAKDRAATGADTHVDFRRRGVLPVGNNH